MPDILPLPDTTTGAQRAAADIRLLIGHSLAMAVQDLRRIRALIYANGAATPQAVFDEFTTSGVSVRDAKAAMITFITAVAVANSQTIDDYIVADDYNPPGALTVTDNGDGTVTVT